MDEDRRQGDGLHAQEVALMKTTANALSWVLLAAGLLSAAFGVLSSLGLYAGCSSLALVVIFALYQVSRRSLSYRCTSPCLCLLLLLYLLAQIAYNVYVLIEAFEVTRYCYGYMRSQCTHKGRKPYIRCKGAGNITCAEKYQLVLTYIVIGVSTLGVMVSFALLTVQKVVESRSRSSYLGLEVEMKTEVPYN